MKKDMNDIFVGLERLSSMLTVFGTYASNYECGDDESIVSPHIIQNAYDLLADYADYLSEDLSRIVYPDAETTGGSEA